MLSLLIMQHKTLWIVVVILVFLVGLVATCFSQKKYGRLPKGDRLKRIEQSPNYSDGQFHNLHPTPVNTAEKQSFLKMMNKFLFDKTPNLRPDSALMVVKTDLKHLDKNQNLIVWFGHSSYYLQLDGVSYLVDPVFYAASPVSFVIKPFNGTNIYKPEDMPDIDYLIITHDHWDHLDYKTVRELKNRIGHVICPLGVGEDFEYWGFDVNKIIEMDWHEKASLSKEVQLHCLPARHFSGRLLTPNKTLWASYMIVSQSKTIFIGGDGGYDTHFAEIGKQFPVIDFAILENGQYNQDWCYIHTMPEYLSREAKELHANTVLTVHHFKYALARHSWDEPEKNIQQMRNDSINVIDPQIGAVVDLP